MAKAAVVQSVKENQYVLFSIGGQMFAISVAILNVVISKQKVTPIPLTPEYVMGCLNLRGRVVTLMNIEMILDVPHVETQEKMVIVLEYAEHLYGFIVDQVSRVLEIDHKSIVTNPGNVSEIWSSLSKGIYKYNKDLVLVLDTDKFLKATLKI